MGKRVAIIGAGITGLVAAFELIRTESDTDCIVLEAAQRIGGNIVTLHIDDCLVDAGPDAVPTVRPEALALCRDLDLFDRLDPPGEHAADVLVARGDRLVRLPDGLLHGIPRRLGALARTPLLSVAGRARALLDLALPRQRQDGWSVGDLVRHRLGREVNDYLVEPMVGGVLAGDIDTLDAAVAMPLRTDATRSLIGAAARARSPDGPVFLSPRGGMCEIVDALAARIGRERIVCGAPVVAVRWTDTRWHVDTAAGETIVADAVVIATPARAASRMLASTDPVLASRLDRLRAGSIATVLIAFDAPPPPPLAGSLFFPRVERRATFAASWLTTKWPWRAPEGRTIVRAFLGGARAPELLQRASDQRLVSLVLADLRAYFDLPAPRWSHVIRFEASAPVPDVGHRARVEQIRGRAGIFSGLFFAGGAYGSGVGLASCVAEGVRAARLLLEAQA